MPPRRIVGWNIDQLKELGVDIEIDDFGTGYASLQKLRPKRLKIDRQLVMPVLVDKAQRQLLSSIIDIGKSMGIEVIAESVETMEHGAILRDPGCDILQGYAFSKPLSQTDLEAFIGAQSCTKRRDVSHRFYAAVQGDQLGGRLEQQDQRPAPTRLVLPCWPDVP